MCRRGNSINQSANSFVTGNVVMYTIATSKRTTSVLHVLYQPLSRRWHLDGPIGNVHYGAHYYRGVNQRVVEEFGCRLVGKLESLSATEGRGLG